MTEAQTRKLLLKLGANIGFHVGEEIQASDSAWVDIVWFDSKFYNGKWRLVFNYLFGGV